MSFRERAISQLFELREEGNFIEYEKLKRNLDFEEISK